MPSRADREYVKAPPPVLRSGLRRVCPRGVDTLPQEAAGFHAETKWMEKPFSGFSILAVLPDFAIKLLKFSVIKQRGNQHDEAGTGIVYQRSGSRR